MFVIREINANDNTKAIRFYQKRGFTITAIHKHNRGHSSTSEQIFAKNALPNIGSMLKYRK